jgi:hypothetical protein
MKKRGQVAIFIIVGLFFVGALVLFAWLKWNSNPVVEERECSKDSDCVPKECCDADLCVPISETPECGQSTPLIYSDDSPNFCPPGCDSYTDNMLGCATDPARESCRCINEKCAPS